MLALSKLFGSIQRRINELPRGAKIFGAAVGTLVLFWPRKTAPIKLDYINTSTRDRWYGPIQFVPNPVPGNPEGIRITNDFEARNIVRKRFPLIGYAAIHKLAAPSLEAALSEIQDSGLGDRVRTFAGGYYPRFVRKSTTNLSSHSYGTSIDINAGENPQGSPPTAEQAELAPIFAKHGWYWGENFSPTRDPMHFEYVLQPLGEIA